MILSPEAVEAYKDVLMNPEKYKLQFKPITQCFDETDTVTAFHILFDQYVKYLGRPLPKAFFYILFEEIFGKCTGKDADGNGGYHMAFKESLHYRHF